MLGRPVDSLVVVNLSARAFYFQPCHIVSNSLIDWK
jgi:hypothetical protein